MNVETKIYFGCGKTKDGKVIKAWTRERALQVIGVKAAFLFGGYTLQKSIGGWIDGGNQNTLVTEEARVLVLLTKGVPKSSGLQRLVDTIKAELKQHAVIVSAGLVAWEEV